MLAAASLMPLLCSSPPISNRGTGALILIGGWRDTAYLLDSRSASVLD